MNDAETMKALVNELAKVLEEKQSKTLQALGARLSEVHTTLNQLGGTLERLAFFIPVEQTAHLAMEALIKSMRGPHEAEDLAKTAFRIAVAMHREARALPKFAETASAAPESTDVEERAESPSEGQKNGASAHTPVSHNSSTL
jgi:hypothetical protein